MKKKNFNDSKSRSEKIKHAKKAFKKRFQHELTDEEYAELNLLAQANNNEVIMWQKGHCSVIKMNWHGIDFYAVYGHQVETIVTFLSLNMEPKFFNDE